MKSCKADCKDFRGRAIGLTASNLVHHPVFSDDFEMFVVSNPIRFKLWFTHPENVFSPKRITLLSVHIFSAIVSLPYTVLEI